MKLSGRLSMNEQEATIKLISMLTNVIKVYQTRLMDNCELMMRVHTELNGEPDEEDVKKLLITSIFDNKDILETTIKQMRFFEGTLIKGVKH